MMFTWPVSSSSVRKVTPLALPGRWRISTIPAVRTGLPCGNAVQITALSSCLDCSDSRNNANG